ncbi:MAG: hypothetical protein FWG62_06010 [Proteobacteria bacterium]|nr:hypothetical protein [Pseudomonadota bacterium]
MRKLAFFAPLTVLLTAVTAFAANMTDYCQAPASISTAVPPNVLLVLDVSGSMTGLAYSGGYSASTTYEGYFDPTKNYQSGTSWTETAASANGTTIKSGNQLNHDNMSRLDLLRWAMTGGTPDGCVSNHNSPKYCDVTTYGSPGSNSLPCDANGCTIVSTGGQKVKARWDRLTGADGGLLYQFRTLPLQPRMGIMLYEATGVVQSVLVGDFTSSNDFDALNPYKNTISAINSRVGTGVTPTAPALWAARAYFAQLSPVFGSPGPQSGNDSWKNPLYQGIDKNGDGKIQGNEIFLVPCAKNFIILLSDGQWNTGGKPGAVGSTCSIDTGYLDGYSADPVVPAYSMHKEGFVNQPTGIRTSISTLYTLGLWIEGTGVTALQNVAMYGGFDVSRDWPGGTTDYPRQTCAVTDCSVAGGKGSPCTPLPSPSFPDWDKKGDGVPDNYLAATSATEIKKSMMDIINDLLKKASSGTGVSVLGSSEGSGANVLQALFYPKRSFANGVEVSWTSDLMNYWYYMDPFYTSMQFREDTIREGADYTVLDLTKDYITSFVYDIVQGKTLAALWYDPAGRGRLDTATSMGQVPIENSKAIWRAGFNLWWTEPTARTVYTSLDGSTLMPFTEANSGSLAPYLGQSGAEAKKVINYSLGYDCADASGGACACGTTGCTNIGRSRTVTAGVCSTRRAPCVSDTDCPNSETCVQETHVWKMGDIISATPRVMGSGPLMNLQSQPPAGYNDQSYQQFISSNDYKDRQLVFSGANDGMLHVFRQGKLLQNWPGKQWYEVGRLEGTTGPGGVGTEVYSFVPKNVMPYLQYLKEEDYCHIYMVDGPLNLIDVSINKNSSCTQANYWDCPKITTMNTTDTNKVEFADTSWRAVLVGSMGIGGATCSAASPSANRIMTPLAVSGNQIGWSSYYALDVTDPAAPQLLWEFSNPDLGVTNVGAGIVKTGGKTKQCAYDANRTCSSDSDCGAAGGSCLNTTNANGRWFAVLPSGSTGPISSNAFQGTSDKTLKLFILDLKTGQLLRTIDTGITNAFAGAISGSTADLDKNSPNAVGNYQDDVMYIGYVRNTTQGGMLRLVINDELDPSKWTFSKVFADGQLGPVTGSTANLIDRPNGKLWLYFGEGRYFYKQDDPTSQRKFFGVQDPCFDPATSSITSTCAELRLTDLQNQTTSVSGLSATQKGWYIQLRAADADAGVSAERVIGNPAINSQGAVFFTSFTPTSEMCGFGGTSYLWAVDYQSGGMVTFKLKGVLLIQLSTGEIKQIDLSTAFAPGTAAAIPYTLGQGDPSKSITTLDVSSPLKQFIHIYEE